MDKFLKYLVDLEKVIKKSITVVKTLNKDVLFVPCNFDVIDTNKKFFDWCFENDIITMEEEIFIESHTLGSKKITGFRFKDVESAMAFKLKWS